MRITPIVTATRNALEPGMDRILAEDVLHWIKNLSVLLALVGFFAVITGVFLKESGIAPLRFAPGNYFTAIYTAFSFILFYEIIAMIYALPGSIARSIGKQYQVISLVLIRHVFEIVGKTGHVEDISNKTDKMLELGVGIFGTLLIFYLIALYRRIQAHRSIVKNKEDLHSFVFIKKIIAILLLTIFLILGGIEFMELLRDSFAGHRGEPHFGHHYYANLFTAMIFVDILLVLVSMSFGDTYHIVFRNTGLMVSTVLLRIGFSSGTITWTILTIAALLVGVLTSLIYRYYLYIDDTPYSVKKKRIQEEEI